MVRFSPFRSPSFDARRPAWLAAGGLLCALLVAAAGVAWERLSFGATTAETVRILERRVRADVAEREAVVRTFAQRLAGSDDLRDSLRRGGDAEASFHALDAAVAAIGRQMPDDLAATAFDVAGQARAWTGRPSALAVRRLRPVNAIFALDGKRGLRLVNVVPVMSAATPTERVGLVVVEREILSPSDDAETDAERYAWRSSLGTLDVRPMVLAGAPSSTGRGFTVVSSTGELLFEAEVDPASVERARQRARARVWRGVGVTLIVTALLAALAFVPRVGARAARGAVVAHSWPILVLVGVARVLAEPLVTAEAAWALDARRLADAVTLACVAAFLTPLALRFRTHGRRRDVTAATPRYVLHLLLAGVFVAAVLAAGTLAVTRVVETASFDVSTLSLRQWSAPRVLAIASLVVGAAAATWLGVLLTTAVWSRWHLPVPATATHVVGMALIATPTVLWLASGTAPVASGVAATAAAVLIAATAALLRRRVTWFRRGTHARRLFALGVLVVAPSALLYPIIDGAADSERSRVVSTRFSVQAQTHPAELRSRLTEALAQIDRVRALPSLVADLSPDPAALDTEAAFELWQRTSLSTARLTSSIELYRGDGRLVSRFALNFPEDRALVQQWEAISCAWDVFGETTPFGAEERQMLHAERWLCDEQGTSHGAIVVHVMLDYEALPFLSSKSPYFEFVRATDDRGALEALRADVTLAIYGWGRTPVFTSAGQAWPLSDTLFARIYASRDPFWTTVDTPAGTQKVYIANDRAGIYAVGYPLPSWFDHAVRVAELLTLATVFFLIGALAHALAAWVAWPTAPPGVRLLREFRTSFSRKLFVAFVLATAVPVLVLAVAIRAYVAGQLRGDIEAEATRTAQVARRVIEETLATQRDGETSATALTDDAMVWISRIIDQDVNIFAGTELEATSERDLFASAVLPTRVPERVYRGLVLDRMPSVVTEDRIGRLQYLMAAVPIRARDVDAILTVPLTLRQREIEREVNELERGVQLGAVVFLLFGAAAGYWMANRIGDPVLRLTRASQRIASGELSVRVFVRTADELQRLVESFNTMAHELEQQRVQLERTNRLEAWAEMARQVAHDIKNPLTPIQLATEHLRRVHHDRGEPLAPVLNQCVETILTQVKLLRRISSDFANFASSPAPTFEPTDIAVLVREILDGYRLGLDARVSVTSSIAEGLAVLPIDRLLVGRALTNVIENALQAVASGGTVGVTVAEESGGVVMRVTDTGPGLDPATSARAFEPYFSTKMSGTGLGLPIARRNIELHGGHVSISSAPGEGTTVSLVLPRPGAATA